jgi:hypothetical protein
MNAAASKGNECSCCKENKRNADATKEMNAATERKGSFHKRKGMHLLKKERRKWKENSNKENLH